MNEATPKVIESVYFHWGNGGLIFKVVEHSFTTGPYAWQKEPEVETHTYYRLDVDASHHGASTKISFDLGSMEIVGWLHEMTGRLLKRMATKPDQGRGLGIFDYHPQGRVSIEDGEEKNYLFRFLDGKVTEEAEEPVSSDSGS